MKKIKVFSSTWAGTATEEIISLEDFGFDQDATEDDLFDDTDAILDLKNIAEQQQHFEWGFQIIDEDD
jgi:hypothetical protein